MGRLYQNEQLVYVLLNKDTNRVKIGITRDIKSRVSTIQCSCGCYIDVLYTSCVLINASGIEKLIHSKFAENRHLGEWFNIDSKYAVDVTKSIVKEYGRTENKSTNTLNNKPLIEMKIPIMQSEGVIHESINLNDYKRIQPGIYVDDIGILYSIKYRINGGWLVNKLTKIAN
jgi:hypothetical protein